VRLFRASPVSHRFGVGNSHPSPLVSLLLVALAHSKMSLPRLGVDNPPSSKLAEMAFCFGVRPLPTLSFLSSFLFFSIYSGAVYFMTHAFYPLIPFLNFGRAVPPSFLPFSYFFSTRLPYLGPPIRVSRSPTSFLFLQGQYSSLRTSPPSTHRVLRFLVPTSSPFLAARNRITRFTRPSFPRAPLRTDRSDPILFPLFVLPFPSQQGALSFRVAPEPFHRG